jgi:hypothetical protein
MEYISSSISFALFPAPNRLSVLQNGAFLARERAGVYMVSQLTLRHMDDCKLLKAHIESDDMSRLARRPLRPPSIPRVVEIWIW